MSVLNGGVKLIVYVREYKVNLSGIVKDEANNQFHLAVQAVNRILACSYSTSLLNKGGITL